MNNIAAYVIGKTRGFYEVLENGKIYQVKLRGVLKKSNNKFNCVIGDEVEISKEDLLITKVFDRKNMILRPLVSNIDNVAIVSSIKDPNFDFLAFQKNLLWLDMEDVKPILIINKIDLISSKEYEEFLNNLKEYCLDILVFPISIKSNIGLDELFSYMENKTIVLSGFSGVGKSSLVNCIMEEDVVLVGDISQKTKKGKNTTIITKYFEKNKIKIFDTPGYSQFDVPKFKDKKDIKKCFKEFIEYEVNCKFKDCLHYLEPNCMVKEALENGKISKKRYDFYISVLEGKYDERN